MVTATSPSTGLTRAGVELFPLEHALRTGMLRRIHLPGKTVSR
jgi:hypothetical protein